MKMIEVYNLLAKGEVKHGTVLVLSDDGDVTIAYKYDEGRQGFFDEYSRLEDDFDVYEKFLNRDVRLLQPNDQEYVVKVNLRGLQSRRNYLNYNTEDNCVFLSFKNNSDKSKTRFTKAELELIEPVCEFLEDLKDRYQLIEAY